MQLHRRARTRCEHHQGRRLRFRDRPGASRPGPFSVRDELRRYRWHFYSKHLWRNAGDRREALASDALLVGLLVGGLVAAPRLVLAAWLVPVTVVTFLLKYTFDYLPHHPHTQQGRFFDTRNAPGRIANVLLLGQSYHGIHHLWTTIPWYHYQQVFEEIE